MNHTFNLSLKQHSLRRISEFEVWDNQGYIERDPVAKQIDKQNKGEKGNLKLKIANLSKADDQD